MTVRRDQRRPAPGLAARLRVDPRTVHELATRLDVSLHWLEIATGPDVIAGTPATWEACLAVGIDPLSGEVLTEAAGCNG